MVQPRHFDDVNDPWTFPSFRGRLELIGVGGRHFGIERPLKNEDGLSDVPHGLGGVKREVALKIRRIGLSPDRGGHVWAIPPLAREDSGLDSPLQVRDQQPFVRCLVRSVETVHNLVDVQLGAADTAGADEHERGHPFVGGQHGDPPAVAVSEERDPLAVHVLPVADGPHGRAHVVGVVTESRGFGAPATLAGTSLVVTQDHETKVSQLARQVSEDGNTASRFIPIDDRRAGHEQDRRLWSAGAHGLRKRAGQPKAVGGNADDFVVRPRDADSPGCDRAYVFSHGVEVLER